MKPYYDEDGITIYHGDCLELLPGLSGIGAVVTDPPYGINTKSDGSGKLNPWADLCNSALWYREWIGACRQRLEHDGILASCLNWRSLTTFQKAACDLPWPIESLAVWDKEWIGPGGSRGLRPSYEMISVWLMPSASIEDRGIPDVVRVKWSAHKPSGHPAEKPIELMSWAIGLSPNKNGTILDPFMGSGTTLRAAKDMGRRAIGCEIDERWCELAAKRLQQGILFPAQ